MFEIDGVTFTERERKLIGNCIRYAENDPAGMPGHNLAVLIAKLAKVYPILGDMDFAMFDGVTAG